MTLNWYGALSDIEGMDESDLVVNWRGERSRGWGGWAERGEVEETFRFACPNNPNVRRKTVRRLRELLTQYRFAGVFLDKIRFPSPAKGIDEMLVLLLRLAIQVNGRVHHAAIPVVMSISGH